MLLCNLGLFHYKATCWEVKESSWSAEKDSATKENDKRKADGTYLYTEGGKVTNGSMRMLQKYLRREFGNSSL